MQKNKIFYFLLLISLSVFSQNKVNISGKVTAENKPLKDVVVELKSNNLKKLAITSKDGGFVFSNINSTINDTLIIKIQQIGFQLFTKTLINIQENNNIEIVLQPTNPNLLNEVVVQNKAIVNKAYKSIYKINSKDFIANTTGNEVLSTVTNVFHNEQTQTTTVDGTLPAKIFINGIESPNSELKTIDAKDINRVEVISNPSSSFGSDFLGAVINIVTKVKTDDFFKGSLEGSVGALRNFWYVDPAVSYKRGRVLFKADFEYKESQNTISNVNERTDNNNFFYQKNVSNSRAIQQYGSGIFNFKANKNSELTIKGYISGYKILSNGYGLFYNNDINTATNYIKNGTNSNGSWQIASVYKHQISNEKTIFIKNKYFEYDDKNILTFNDFINPINNINVVSKNKEFAGELNFEDVEVEIFKQKSEFYSGVKYINRNFIFSQNTLDIRQNII